MDDTAKRAIDLEKQRARSERYLRRHPDKRAQSQSKYVDQNRDQINERLRNKRRLLREQGLLVDQDAIIEMRRKLRRLHTAELLAKQDHKCANPFCRARLGPKHIDHKTPIICGGSNLVQNLQLLCPKCNMAKGSMTMDEWLR